MSSYSHLNIALLRMKLKELERKISSINKTIAHHEQEIKRYERELAKYNRRWFPNGGLIRGCEKSIWNYKNAIKELRRESEYFEKESEKIKEQLAIKKRRRRRGGLVVTIMIAGFVLINARGEIKDEVKETSSMSNPKEDDSSKTNPEETISYREDLETVIDEILGFFDGEKSENPEVSDLTR